MNRRSEEVRRGQDRMDDGHRYLEDIWRLGISGEWGTLRGTGGEAKWKGGQIEKTKPNWVRGRRDRSPERAKRGYSKSTEYSMNIETNIGLSPERLHSFEPPSENPCPNDCEPTKLKLKLYQGLRFDNLEVEYGVHRAS